MNGPSFDDTLDYWVDNPDEIDEELLVIEDWEHAVNAWSEAA